MGELRIAQESRFGAMVSTRLMARGPLAAVGLVVGDNCDYCDNLGPVRPSDGVPTHSIAGSGSGFDGTDVYEAERADYEDWLDTLNSSARIVEGYPLIWRKIRLVELDPGFGNTFINYEAFELFPGRADYNESGVAYPLPEGATYEIITRSPLESETLTTPSLADWQDQFDQLYATDQIGRVVPVGPATRVDPSGPPIGPVDVAWAFMDPPWSNFISYLEDDLGIEVLYPADFGSSNSRSNWLSAFMDYFETDPN